MQADKKIECFAVRAPEDVLYYGTISGQLVTLEIDTFAQRHAVQAHAGTIIAISAHPTEDYLACLGMDRTVSLWSTRHITPRHLASASIRNLAAANDEITYHDVKSNAQAIGFHPKLNRLVTRTANGAVAELDFDETGFSLVRCVRFHRLYDVITARYAIEEPHEILTGSGDGEAVLSRDGEVIRRWQIEHESVHWFEPLGGREYVVASDSRLLARISLDSDEVSRFGPKFARDDFEHVVYNAMTKKVFASSFDRTVYELDPQTCECVRIVFNAPFKCRWLHSLSRAPDQLIVQVRDGTLIAVDVPSGKALRSLRTTPAAIWTGVDRSGERRFYGEGKTVLELAPNPPSATTSVPSFTARRSRADWAPETGYFKRADHDRASGRTFLGHSSGTLVALDHNAKVDQTDLGAAIRDVRAAAGHVFAVTENGMAFKIRQHDLCITAEFKSPSRTPLWALAVTGDAKRVAVFERHGRISILDGDTLALVRSVEDGGRCKRAKWIGGSQVLFTKAGEIHQLDICSGDTVRRVEDAGNTVEDFIWDWARNYIVCIGYTNTIGLYDFNSGERLDEVHDQIDYAKGLAWTQCEGAPSGYPLDFFTYGRGGSLHLRRIHNESIVPLGVVSAVDG
jgi:WD40 repeat protein